MLPDVDADEWHEVEERVLVRRRGDFKTLGSRVQALQLASDHVAE